MRIEILVPVLTVTILLLLLFLVVCFIMDGIWHKKKTWLAMQKRTLSMIISCNTYPKMLTVFTKLENDVAKYNIEVKDNFRGYFKNE